jgi:hypothetical protein
VSVLCCQVEVSATGRSLVQRGPTECCLSECDCEASTVRRPWPTGGCCAKDGDVKILIYIITPCSFVGDYQLPGKLLPESSWHLCREDGNSSLVGNVSDLYQTTRHYSSQDIILQFITVCVWNARCPCRVKGFDMSTLIVQCTRNFS